MIALNAECKLITTCSPYKRGEQKGQITLNKKTMEEFEWGAFAFGFIMGAVITACALSKGIRNGFKSLVVGVWNRVTGKGGGK